MKVAVACDSQWVSPSFGRCPEYRVFDVQDGVVAGHISLKSPGHRPGVLPRLLVAHGIDCIIAGGMGPAAVKLFQQNNVRVVLGSGGKVEEVIQAFVDGTLQADESASKDHW